MAFLVYLITIPSATVLISFVFCMYFWRSSPVWPTTAHNLWIEALFQFYGFLAFVEDKSYQSVNSVELSDERNRVAIVTGGNRGIGVHVVDKLLNCRMTVIVAVRDPERAKVELARVISVEKFKGQLHIEQLDMTDFASIRRFAETISAKLIRIDILVHNAGIMACPYKKTVDGFESQMQTNYLGQFLLTHLLMPKIKASGTETKKSRIVLVSSILHFVGQVPFKDFNCSLNYYPVEAYANSKLCQVMMAKEWQRLGNSKNENVQIFSVHPGLVNTELIEYLAKKRQWWRENMCKTPEEGSRPIVFAATSKELDNIGGDYVSNCQKTGAKSCSDDLRLGEKLFKFTCNMLKIEKFGG